MDLAIVIENDEPLYASEVDHWPEARKRGLYGQGACPECKTLVRFRSHSSNGHAPTFYATPHPDCELGSEAGERASAPGTTVNPREAREDEKELRLDDDEHVNVNVDVDPDGTGGAGGASGRRARRYDGEGTAGVATASVGLGALLVYLARDPEYRKRDTLLRLSRDGSKMPLSELCVETGEIRDADVNRKAVYWGQIEQVHPHDDGGAWLWTRFDHPNLRLWPEVVAKILDSGRYAGIDELAGYWFATLATLNRRAPDSRPYLAPRSERPSQDGKRTLPADPIVFRRLR